MPEILASEQFVFSGAKKLRCGFTTGTCAALASRAAVESLLSARVPKTVSLRTPKGWLARADVVADAAELVPFASGGMRFRCGVKKDAGDDPDVTDGCLVFATAELFPAAPTQAETVRMDLAQTASTQTKPAQMKPAQTKPAADGDGSVRVSIDGGAGVGRVTKPGLDQPVGVAAINRVPRQMIADAVCDVCEAFGFAGEVRVTIDIPEGERLSEKTFNPQLGIEGGISVIGTSGVVEPMSEQALVDALETEIRVIAASYEDKSERPLVITPGNYGKDFVARYPELEKIPVLKCSNFIGAALDLAVAYGFTHVTLVGHAGKFVKLAGGIMNTHSRAADCRMELLCAHAALCGAEKTVLARIMDCATVDAALSVLDEARLTERTVRSLVDAAKTHVTRRVDGAYSFDIVLFTNERGVIGAVWATEDP